VLVKRNPALGPVGIVGTALATFMRPLEMRYTLPTCKRLQNSSTASRKKMSSPKLSRSSTLKKDPQPLLLDQIRMSSLEMRRVLIVQPLVSAFRTAMGKMEVAGPPERGVVEIGP
jgi:hypothetical protein